MELSCSKFIDTQIRLSTSMAELANALKLTAPSLRFRLILSHQAAYAISLWCSIVYV